MDRPLGEQRRPGPHQRRLHRRLRQRRDLARAAADERERGAPDQPRQPLSGFHRQRPRRAGARAGVLLPHGKRTFARLIPSFRDEARATVAYMRSLGVRRLYLLADDADALDAEIVPLVAADAPAAGIAVVGRRTVDAGGSSTPVGIDRGRFATLARAAAASHADAVLYGGAANATAPALWAELHAVLPRAKLFAPSTLAVPSFLGALGAAADATYATSPYLEPWQYPAAARRVFRGYRRAYPGIAPTVYTLYGYEAIGSCSRRSPGPAARRPTERRCGRRSSRSRDPRRHRRLSHRRQRRHVAGPLRRLPRGRRRPARAGARSQLSAAARASSRSARAKR